MSEETSAPRLNLTDITNSFVSTLPASVLNDAPAEISCDEGDWSDADDHHDEANDSQIKKKRVLNRNQRVAANQRERKRMNIMNESYSRLRHALPISAGRKRRKMSRLDIVVGAMEYIDYLDQLLETHNDADGPIRIDFEAYQNRMYDY